MSDDTIHRGVQALVREGYSLREALLAQDLTAVRSCARQMASIAELLGFARVESAACALVEAMGPDGTVPRPDYARAVFALSGALDEATW